MSNERDDILKDLFDYYDTESETDFSAGDTTVINTKHIPPAEETFGDTMVVGTKNIPTPDLDEELEDTGATTVITPPVSHAPAEEVLGSMYTEKYSEIAKPIQTASSGVTQPRQMPSGDSVVTGRSSRSQQSDVPPERPTGVWYALKPLWVSLIVCAVLVCGVKFYFTDSGPIGIYKRNFSYNFSLIMRVFGIDTDTDEVIDTPIIGNAQNESLLAKIGLETTAYAEENTVTYSDGARKKATVPFPGAGLAQYRPYDGGVVCAKSNYLCFIDDNGEIKWEYSTAVSEPILAVSGKYTALASSGSTQLSLYKSGKLLYTIDAPAGIKTCSVSKKGDVAVVTDKTAYKGAVSVYNTNGEEVFSWVSGVNYITSATVTNNRHVAVSLVSTEDTMTSYVMVFDIFSPDPINGAEFSDTLVYNTSSRKNTIYAFGDNSVSGVNSKGETIYNVRFDNMAITHSVADANGWRVVSFTDNYVPYFNIYNKNGSLRYSVNGEASPDYVSLYKSTILYNVGRDVICGKATAKAKTRYPASMTVKNLVMLTENTYMIAYENNIEFIKI